MDNDPKKQIIESFPVKITEEKTPPPKPKTLLFVIIATVLLVIFAGTYVLSTKTSKQTVKPSPPSQPTPTSNPTANSDSIRANWKIYIDPINNFSFKYPADFKTLPNLGDHVLYSPDAKFDKTTKAKISGIEIGSTIYGPGEDDAQNYLGPNTKIDAALASNVSLPVTTTKAYVNTEDITITIDFKKNNKNMRILIWCGGENGDSVGCKKILTPLLSTFKFN